MADSEMAFVSEDPNTVPRRLSGFAKLPTCLIRAFSALLEKCDGERLLLLLNAASAPVNSAFAFRLANLKSKFQTKVLPRFVPRNKMRSS